MIRNSKKRKPSFLFPVGALQMAPTGEDRRKERVLEMTTTLVLENALACTVFE
jgi:hypothetical protein